MTNEINTNSQHVGIVHVDDKGIILNESEINFIFILSDLYNIKNFKIRYKLLSTIDLYGDTIFNRLQSNILIKELEDLLKEKIGNRTKKDIISSIYFIKKSLKNLHTYIKFIGD